MAKSQIIFIVGPTAIGKTEVAYRLAKKLKTDIVSCDSMLVYKDVNIANAKPPKKYLESIDHHLVGVVPVSKDFDVATFNKKATAAIQRILNENKIPIVVGGSGLYMQILLDGIFEKNMKDDILRQELKKELEQGKDLHKELKKLDPVAAKRIHPNDQRRLIRALEVCKITNKPISALQTNRKGLWGEFEIRVFGLNMDRKKLYERINERVDDMFDEGVIEEVKTLSKKKLSRTAQKIIAVEEIQGFINGEYNEDRARDLMKRNTRRLAKRQLTWFRKEKRIDWINLKKDNDVKTIIEYIQRKL